MTDTIEAPPTEEPKPFKWTFQELKKARQEGSIDKEQAADIWTDLKVQGNLYDMSKEEVRYAAKRGKLNLSQVEKYVERKKHPFWWHTKDAAKGFATGTKNFMENLSEQYYGLENWITGGNVDPKFDPKLAPDAPEAMGGEIVSAGTEFMMAYGGASKALAATGAVKALMAAPRMAKLAASSPKVAAFVGAAIEGTVAGAPADYISFDIKDGRVADLMEEHGVLPEFLNFMTTDDDNPEGLERFKNVVEGAFIGSAIEAVVLGAKLFKAGTHAKYNGFVDNLKLDIATDSRLSAAQQQSYLADVAQVAEAQKQEASKLKRADHFKKQIDNLEAKGTALDENELKQLEVLKEREAKVRDSIRTAKQPDVLPIGKGPKMGNNTARAFNIKEALTSGADPKYQGDVLLKHMEDAPDAQTVIKHVYDNAEAIIEAERKRQSHGVTRMKSTKDLAKVTGGSVDAMMNHMRNTYGDIINATERAHAMYRVLETYSDQVAKMANEYTGATEDALKLMEHIKQLEELQAMVYGVRSESGRLLNMHNMGIKKARFDFSEFKAIEDLPSYIQNNRDSFEKTIKNFGQMKTMEERLKFSRFMGKGGIMPWLLSYRQAQLLWNPVTHLINTTSQTGATAVRIATRAIGHGMDALVHLDPQRLKALRAEMAGYLEALKVSFKFNTKKVKEAHKALRKADPTLSFKDAIVKNPELGTFYRATIGREGIIDPGVKWSDEAGLTAMLAASPIGKIGRTIDAALKLPFNALAGVDEVFKTLGTQSEYYSLVYREGLDLARKGKITDTEAFFKSEMKKGRPDYFNQALAKGKELTFQDDLTGASKKLNEALNASGTATAVRMMFIPFYKTTVNLVKWAGKNSPVGLLSKGVWNNMLKGGVDMWEQVARMSLGSAAMYWSWGMFAEGKVTGRLPADKRAVLQSAGVQEYSYLNDDGKWVSYRRTDPFGMWMAFTADLHLAMDVYDQYESDDDIDTKIEDVWAAGMHAIMDPVVGATWMKGAQDMFEFIGDPDKSTHKAKQVLMKQAGSMIPGATAIDYVNSEFGSDDYYRQLNEWVDVIYQKIDSGKLLKKRDPIYGNPVEREERWGHMVRQTTMTDDPVKIEMVRTGMKVSKLRDSLEFVGEPVKITPEVLDRYYDLYAQFPIKETLTQIVEADAYKEMGDDKTKAELLSSVITLFRGAAKDLLIAEQSQITDEAISRVVRRAEGIAGIRTNRDKTSALYRWAHTLKE